ncbi:MAG: tetratricopeptide repeat protein, partial [Fibrobacter sp.]|nr:tetratricopeptide repeat protein [Fibrobacter sp.]
KCMTIFQNKPKTLFGLILLMAAVCGLLQCSAYFNTYYNADLAFREAYAVHKKILRQYPDSLIVSPPDDISTKYERVIEKSIKVMDVYSKKTKWHDDALLLMGKAYFYKNMMLKAIGRLTQLQKEFPSSALIPESYVYLAKAYIETGELVKAEDIIHDILEKYPYLNKDQSLSLLLVDISLRREGRAQAIAILEKALKAAKNEETRLDLLLRIGVLYIELNQYDRAISILRTAPRSKKFVLNSYRMDDALVKCYVEIDSLQLALDLCDDMYSNGRYYTYMSNILFQKGLILEKMGRIDDAIEVYERITEGIDSTNVASDTSSIAAKAFYRLALIYQKQLKDYGKAGDMFTMASKMRDSSSMAMAKVRLSAMERLKALREQKDSLKTERDFKIGEVFLFELDEPDSAYSQFMTLIKENGNDTEFVQKALCLAAIVARDGLKDTLRADSLFKVVIAAYPSSEFAKKAQEEMNVAVTVKTVKDSAMEAFRNAEKMLYQENANVKDAVQAFYDVYREYPEIEDVAAKSLFAAAWATDVILQKNVTAKSLYEKICEKYPESEYCTREAQPRLKIVADTLGAIEKRRGKKSEKKKKADIQKPENSKEPVDVENTGTPESKDEKDVPFPEENESPNEPIPDLD